MNLSDAEYQIVAHALGMTEKKILPATDYYRNRYIAGENDDKAPILNGLVMRGIMAKSAPVASQGKEFLWSVTDFGTQCFEMDFMSKNGPSINGEIQKLQAFKDYVHGRLDEAEIPTNPDGPHSEKGCRIGDRLDVVFDTMADLIDKLNEVEFLIGITPEINKEKSYVQLVDEINELMNKPFMLGTNTRLGWIKFADQEPEVSQAVLFGTNNMVCQAGKLQPPYTSQGHFHGNGQFFNAITKKLETATHWMPKPELKNG